MSMIKDVVKLVGVFVVIVFRVLNKNGYVYEDILKKVECVIEMLDYKFSIVVCLLYNKKFCLIGLVVLNIVNLFFLEVVCVVEDVVYK